MEFLQLYAIGFALGFVAAFTMALWYLTDGFRWDYIDYWSAILTIAVSFVGGVTWILSIPIILLTGLLYFTIKLIRELKK